MACCIERLTLSINEVPTTMSVVPNKMMMATIDVLVLWASKLRKAM
jgi:hypothetical protein